MTFPLHTTAGTPRLLKDMTPGQVADILTRDPRLIIAVGTCEQHGPHLPLGTATMIADALANDLSATHDVLRAPTIEYGVNVGTERGFPGNASMRKKTLHRMLNDLLATWESSGFREFILLTAHDHDPQEEALATVMTTIARVRVVDVFAVDISDLLEGQTGHMHGGEVDTSLMLYLAPQHVHMELAQDSMMSRDDVRRYRRGRLRVPRRSAGSIGCPTLASAVKGQAIYDRILQRISDRVFRVPSPDE